MLSPSAFYCFTHISKVADGGGYRYCFAYKPPGPLARGALDELILAMCKGPHVPDAVIVLSIGDDDGSNDVLALLKEDGAKIAQQRLASRIPLLHANYDLGSGAVKTVLLDPYFESKKKKLNKVCQDVKSWMKSGLAGLLNPADVILQAPSGYAYEKPSGGRAKVFLKPDMALKSSAAVAFISFALFNKIFSGRMSRFSGLRTVFIDTMAIAPVAYALKELLALCDPGRSFLIESFHSYGGFDDIKRPLPGTSLCIISASTSMDLHRKWISDKQVAPYEVVTILSLQSAAYYKEDALHLLEYEGEFSASGPVQLSIRIRGESFLPEQESPKKVLLTESHHRSDESTRFFCTLAGKGVFDVYRKPSASDRVRALYVAGDVLINQDIFAAWLNEQLFGLVKAATKAIICQNDSSSLELAGLVRKYCLSEFGLNLPPAVPLSKIESSNVDFSGGVIVCAAVVGKGSQLLEISRALRDKHKGPRLYVIGFHVAETNGELKSLPMNLRHSKGVKHEVICYGGVATGTQLQASFEREVAEFCDPSLDTSDLPAAVQRRALALGASGVVGQSALLPHGNEASGVMHLRQGFAFWPEFTPVSCQPEVLATMAALLQRAREAESLPENKRLATASYRHVVLDPENFSRYNDGVIQSSIIRSAYPSELDYRSDHAASDFMKALIIRSLNRANEEAGEAALEFMLAIASRKIQLSKQHYDEVIILARAISKGSSGLSRMIAFLFNFDEFRKQKLPF